MLLAVFLFLETIRGPRPVDVVLFGPASTEFKQYVSCLDAEAQRLEVSDAAPDDVFDATVTACDRQWGRTFDELKAKLMRDGKLVAVQAHQRSLDLMREMIPNWRANQRLAVLRARAERKAAR